VRAVFLDRDGVINYNREEYVKSPEEFVFLPGSATAVARLSSAGFGVFVVSNQAGVGKGLMTERTLDAITERMREGLAAEGGLLQGVYYCPHRPDAGCDCRKPKPGLLRQAAREHGIDLSRALMIGDAPRDIEAGAAVGARTVLVLSGKTSAAHGAEFTPRPSHIAADLSAAVDWILEHQR
jgi:histidinol-phosphate phosphatase family protein